MSQLLMVPDDTLIPLTIAHRATGVPRRTIYEWVRAGKLAAQGGNRKQLVRVGDVRELTRFWSPRR